MQRIFEYLNPVLRIHYHLSGYDSRYMWLLPAYLDILTKLIVAIIYLTYFSGGVAGQKRRLNKQSRFSTYFKWETTWPRNVLSVVLVISLYGGTRHSWSSRQIYKIVAWFISGGVLCKPLIAENAYNNQMGSVYANR